MWITQRQELARDRMNQLKEKKMTTDTATVTSADATPVTAAAPPLLDDKGYVDLSRLRREYDHLRKLLDERRLLDAAIETYEAQFKQAVEAAGARGFTIDGLPRVTWKPDGSFPVARYTAANPHVAAAYTRTVTRQEFDLDAFRRDRGAEYEQWRARSFRHVTGKE